MKTMMGFAALLTLPFVVGCASMHDHRLDTEAMGPNEKRSSVIVGFENQEVSEGDRVRIYEVKCRTRLIRGGDTIPSCRDSATGTARVVKILDQNRAELMVDQPSVLTAQSRFEKIKQ